MQCFSPMHIRNLNKTGPEFLTVPCGKCPACVQSRASSWFVRLAMQWKYSESAYFLTLTYNDGHLPSPRRDDNGFIHYDVNKNDVRLYHYRLRKALGYKSKKLKYFLVSEYGPNPENGWLYRPHYHEIIFSLDVEDVPKIERAWKNGFVKLSEVNEERLRYVSGYSTEKLFVPCGAAPSFLMCSNGIGSAYLSEFDGFNDYYRPFVPFQGTKYPLPRYFKEKVLSKAVREQLAKDANDRAEATYQAHLNKFGGDHDALQKYYHDMRADYLRKIYKKHKKKQSPYGTD